MIKNIFLDFDGTIVDSGSLIHRNLAKYVSEGIPSWEELRKLPSHEVVSSLKLSKFDLPKLIFQIRSDFRNHLSEMPIVPGMKESITQFKNSDVKLFLCSSNSEENMTTFLKRHGIEGAFSAFISMSTIFGKAKGLKAGLKKYKLLANETVYLGDETRDIEASRKAGIMSASVTWGYNNSSILRQFNPDFIFDKPEELERLLC